MIRTLVCAASELARAGLVAVVRADTRLALAGEATPAGLAARVRALDPDVVLEERAPAAAAIGTPSVALVDDPAAAWTHARDARSERGAHAILGRDASPSEIVGAIVAVAAGLVAAQPHVLESLFDHPSRGSVRNGTRGDDGRADRDDVATHGERLTVREIDVLGELARGSRTRRSRHACAFPSIRSNFTSRRSLRSSPWRAAPKPSRKASVWDSSCSNVRGEAVLARAQMSADLLKPRGRSIRRPLRKDNCCRI